MPKCENRQAPYSHRHGLDTRIVLLPKILVPSLYRKFAVRVMRGRTACMTTSAILLGLTSAEQQEIDVTISCHEQRHARGRRLAFRIRRYAFACTERHQSGT